MQTTRRPPNFHPPPTINRQQMGGQAREKERARERGRERDRDRLTNGSKPAEQAKQLMLTEVSQPEHSQIEIRKQDQHSGQHFKVIISIC